MKYILILIFLFNSLFALDIDIKMFDQKESISYLVEIEKKIIESKNNKTKPADIISEELFYLTNLKEALNKKVFVDKSKLALLNKNENNVENILKKLKHSIEITQKIENQDSLILDIQNKLSFSKKQIENFTKDDANNSLLYQLQFAYFKVQQNSIQKRKELLKNFENELFDDLQSDISKLKKVDLRFIEKEEMDNEEKIKALVQKKAQLQIKIEKAKIEDNKNNYEKYTKNLLDLEKNYQELMVVFIDSVAKNIIGSFHSKSEQDYIKYFKLLEDNVIGLNEQNLIMLNSFKSLLSKLAKNIFGNTKVMIANSFTEFEAILQNIKSKLTGTLFIFNEQPITFLSLLKAFVFIILGFFVGYIYKRWLLRISTNWSNVSDMSIKISANVGYYLIVFIFFIIAITSLGIDLTSLSLIAGALSIGIGFGLQTVVSNFIAGIIIMFERTIRIGDLIEVNDLLRGTVSDIRIRSTTIKTFDNIDIVVPNSSFIQNNVINWTLEDKTRRLHIPFGVAYGTKIEKVKEVILFELNNSNLVFVRDVEGKSPDIRMEMMNSSSVDLELLVWVEGNERVNPNSKKSDFLILIYNTLYKHNIEIPFPQLDLHMKK